MYGRIPYLNGGMFDEHTLELQYANIDISDEAFDSLFAFFDQWHWHLDDRHTATGKDINPDVLGYIFEQYINDRAAMGALLRASIPKSLICWSVEAAGTNAPRRGSLFLLRFGVKR